MIRIWKNASLRTQLVAIISALLAVSLLALGSATYVLLHAYLQEQMDSQLKTYQTAIAKAGISPADTNGNSAFPFDYYVRYSYDNGTVFAQNRQQQQQDRPALGAYNLAQATELSKRQPFSV
ncbi:MAG TPA: two-component sensor histidine kinase, partial [Micrococcaceae bacterium]